MSVTYFELPSIQQFKKDSSVFMADRSRDRVLLELDRLLTEFPNIREATAEQTKIRTQFHLAKLWFACDYWLKIVDGGSRYAESANMNSGRRPVIYALYASIVRTLVAWTKIPVNKLPDWLRVTFGRGMELHGIETDRGSDAVYLCAEDLRWFRLHIQHGIILQHRWWENSTELVRADSRNSLMAANADAKAREEGLSGYAVSMGRDFYVAPHYVRRPSAKDSLVRHSFYHSSYLAGQSVMCAGTTKIVNGEMTLITNDSGHYRPGAGNLAQAVEALAVVGVRLDKLRVRAFGKPECNGEEFLLREKFDLTDIQAKELERELLRVTELKKIGDDARRVRSEKLKIINELVTHMKTAHGSKAGFRCATCDRYRDRDTMTVALWVLKAKK